MNFCLWLFFLSYIPSLFEETRIYQFHGLIYKSLSVVIVALCGPGIKPHVRSNANIHFRVEGPREKKRKEKEIIVLTNMNGEVNFSYIEHIFILFYFPKINLSL